MVTLILSYDGRITVDREVVNYIDGKSAISSTKITTTLTHLKEFVNVCDFSSEVVHIDLLWKLGNNLYPINDEDSLDDIFLSMWLLYGIICGSKSRSWWWRWICVEEDEWEDSYVGDDTEVESPTYTADCGLQLSDDDTSIHAHSSQPITFRQFPQEFTSGDWQDEFECTDWMVTHGESSTGTNNFQVGVEYETKVALQQHVKMWHISNTRGFTTVKSSPSVVSFKCANKSSGVCSWSLREMQKRTGNWEISKLGLPHSCKNVATVQHHRQLDCKLIVQLIYP